MLKFEVEKLIHSNSHPVPYSLEAGLTSNENVGMSFAPKIGQALALIVTVVLQHDNVHQQIQRCSISWALF
jgi:cell division inhibitor SulA